MDTTGATLQVLPDYQLKLCFPNGSEALINMKPRVKAIRFGLLSSPELFAAARRMEKWDGKAEAAAYGRPSTNCWTPCR